MVQLKAEWGEVSLWTDYLSVECSTERDLDVTVNPNYILTHLVSSGAGIPTPASALSLHHNK